MNTESLFLFLILLLGLVLCSFLGGNYVKEGLTGNFTGTFNVSGNSNANTQSYSGASTGSGNQYDNYNHYTGTSTQLSSGSTFYGQNGTSAVVVANSDGSQSLQITLPGTYTPLTFNPQQLQTSMDPSSSSVESYTNYYGKNGSATTYYGPSGAIATVINTDNGQQAIRVTTSSGTYYYNVSGTPTTTNTSTQYYGSTGSQIQQSPYSMSYQEPSSTGSVTGPAGNTAYYAKGQSGNTVVGTTSNDYYSSLPSGISGSQIPPGQEDLYILKSQVVPPVCPACPTSSACPRQEPCPPCPACARCPEPAFECKKVPNYKASSAGNTFIGATSNGYGYSSNPYQSPYEGSSINNEYLPTPVLSDFSTFGM